MFAPRTLLLILVMGMIVALAVRTYTVTHNQAPSNSSISSYEECVEAGYPILESYPEQCRTPDGASFTRVIPQNQETPEEQNNTPTVFEDMIRVTSPVKEEVITSPVTIMGQARGGWYFEATFPIILQDSEGKIITEHYATAILDPKDPESTWMTEEYVPFESTLTFEKPSTPTGTLIIKKSNASGDPAHDASLKIPVRFGEANSAKKEVQIYVYNESLDKDSSGNILCSTKGLVPVIRQIPQSQTPLTDTLRFLLSSPLLPQEQTELSTFFPLEGMSLEHVSLKDGTLVLPFKDPLQKTSGGACRVELIRQQIIKTALQFDTVDEVVLLPEELFQP